MNFRLRYAVVMAILAGLLAIFPLPGNAQGVDCPAAFRPYSADTVLLDLYINPATRAIIEAEAPGFFGDLPHRFARTEPPTFMAIATLRQANGQIAIPAQRMSSEGLEKVNAQLGNVPVSHEASVARCARYDETSPVISTKLKAPAILVFSKITGFKDAGSVDAATAALKTMAAQQRWTLVFTENGAAFNPKLLKRFKAVIWNNVSGDVLTNRQRAAFKDYIEAGGGFVGLHGSGGDPYYDWDWYVDALVGARFMGHPGTPQFQAARVIVDDPNSAITAGLGDWTMTEEWYSFRSSPRATGAHILLRLDESTYSLLEGDRDIHMGADHPIAWTQCLGKGRSFYSAIGHRPESYSEPNTLLLMQRGISWAAGLGATHCVGGHESG